jgi:hypothetical protein
MRVEVIQKDFPYEDITQLLHECYREHLDAGRNYLAAVQSVEKTKARLEGSYCVVAYDEDTLVGTASFRIHRHEEGVHRKWYEARVYIYVGQLAVLPSYRNTKVLTLMGMKAASLKEVRECQSCIADTSVQANVLVEGYLKMGFQIVDLISWETTNYYSYVFRRNVSGKEFSDSFCKFRFTISKFLCMMRYTKNGKKRFI